MFCVSVMPAELPNTLIDTLCCALRLLLHLLFQRREPGQAPLHGQRSRDLHSITFVKTSLTVTLGRACNAS